MDDYSYVPSFAVDCGYYAPAQVYGDARDPGYGAAQAQAASYDARNAQYRSFADDEDD